MHWYHFPIRDVDAPTPEAVQKLRHLSSLLHQILENGGGVLIHCRDGLGRAGMGVALLLVERRHSASEAMKIVRAARPGAIETPVQEHLVATHGRHERLRPIQIHASLPGGAIGDSLGADIEFLSLAETRCRYPGDIKDLPSHMGLRGAITDDTQMTLFTAYYGRDRPRAYSWCAKRYLPLAICDPSCAFALVQNPRRQTEGSNR